MLLCVDFCGGYCSFLVNYSVGLEKAGLRVNRGLSQTAKEKDIVSNTKVQFLKRPSTDFDLKKNTFLESAHHQLSNGICRFFWAFHDLPTNRALSWHAESYFWCKGRDHPFWEYFNSLAEYRKSEIWCRGVELLQKKVYIHHGVFISCQLHTLQGNAQIFERSKWLK